MRGLNIKGLISTVALVFMIPATTAMANTNNVEEFFNTEDAVALMYDMKDLDLEVGEEITYTFLANNLSEVKSLTVGYVVDTNYFEIVGTEFSDSINSNSLITKEDNVSNYGDGSKLVKLGVSASDAFILDKEMFNLKLRCLKECSLTDSNLTFGLDVVKSISSQSTPSSTFSKSDYEEYLISSGTATSTPAAQEPSNTNSIGSENQSTINATTTPNDEGKKGDWNAPKTIDGKFQALYGFLAGIFLLVVVLATIVVTHKKKINISSLFKRHKL